MFNVRMNHVCAIGNVSSHSFVPPLPPGASHCARLKRFLKKLILVTEINPRSIEHFRSTAEIVVERKKHVESRSWIIHPFSIWRVFYEMWMVFVFFFCLVYLPVRYGFSDLIGRTPGVDWFLNICCYVDIVMNFCTGYKNKKNEEVVMKPSRIAKHYIFGGPYFFSDILSSIPQCSYSNADPIVVKVFDLLIFFKIFRLVTLLDYTTATLNLFRVKSTVKRVVILIMLSLLVLHYLACIFPILASMHRYFQDFDIDEALPPVFWYRYARALYWAATFILGIDVGYRDNLPWSYFMTAILFYFAGKILLLLGTVEIIDMLKNRNALEIKYYSMMSQIDAYMEANQFPEPMQKRLKEYYLHKYCQKYFKENAVKTFISEKLKKEINFHTCITLINSVQIFKSLPRETVEEILFYLKPELYLTNDVVIKAGAEGDCMYFLSSGTVTVISPSGKEICHLSDGDYFGEICMLTKNKRLSTVIALEICDVYKLDRRGFKKCLLKNSAVYKEIMTEAKRRARVVKELERGLKKPV